MTHTFTTNINCSGCVAKVTPYLDGHDEIIDWEVDTDDERKTLYVTSPMTPEEIIETIKQAGYAAKSM